MKNKVLLALAIFGAALFFTNCEEEEDNEINDPYQRIEGKWNMNQFSMRGDPMPVEGSYWEFMYTDSQNPPYQGIDSLALYESAGTFEYEFSQDEDTLFITDTLQYGGYFNGKWVIQTFEESSLEMVREYDDEWGDTLKFSRQ